jgi:hypothetical protein
VGNAQSQNKITRALKESILQALEEAGGNEGAVGYLRWLAHENPSAFAGLLGKVLPMTIASTGQDGALKIILEQRIVRPQDRNSGGVRALPETSPAITAADERQHRGQPDAADCVSPRALSILRPSRRIASRCAPRAMNATSCPAAATCPPK